MTDNKEIRPVKILLIEDDTADAEIIRVLLSKHGTMRFDIHHESRLKAAIERLKPGHPYDVVLLDLSLPDSHGLSTVEKVAGEFVDVPVVVLTGLDDDAVGVKAVETGAQDYVLKSTLNPTMLPRIIQYAIRRKKVENQLRENERRALELSRMKNDFASMVNHELNNPIAAISGAATILGEDAGAHAQMEERHIKFIRLIRKNVDRLLRLSDDLRETLGIEGGRFSIHVSEGDMNAVALDVCRTVKSFAEERSITLSGPVPGASVPLVFDEQRIEQVLSNIVRNAIRFAESRVDVKIESVDGTIKIVVEDDGPGLGSNDIPHLFEKFYRGRQTEKTKAGSGLGLAIAHAFVQAHGGQILAENREGQPGARFSVSLPKGIALPAKPKKRVLIIDDEPDLVQVYKDKIEQLGVEVFVASNASDGRITLRANHPDLVLLDLHMPEENGFQFLANYFRETVQRRPPIYVFSARIGGAEHVNEARRLGAMDFFEKTTDDKRLMESISRALSEPNPFV